MAKSHLSIKSVLIPDVIRMNFYVTNDKSDQLYSNANGIGYTTPKIINKNIYLK